MIVLDANILIRGCWDAAFAKSLRRRRLRGFTFKHLTWRSTTRANICPPLLKKRGKPDVDLPASLQ